MEAGQSNGDAASNVNAGAPGQAGALNSTEFTSAELSVAMATTRQSDTKKFFYLFAGKQYNIIICHSWSAVALLFTPFAGPLTKQYSFNVYVFDDGGTSPCVKGKSGGFCVGVLFGLWPFPCFASLLFLFCFCFMICHLYYDTKAFNVEFSNLFTRLSQC